eukprot:TRINITY_DN26772_c0_g1_i1.p1 TRINITY_DN26772_c0_g1~~TRINITY_DN26772_c0_g1_i1.p1  ORF type:complete len:367 (-),score=67.32 TRINITY_DN26772_c0_g1_i1:244-1344(-)
MRHFALSAALIASSSVVSHAQAKAIDEDQCFAGNAGCGTSPEHDAGDHEVEKMKTSLLQRPNLLQRDEASIHLEGKEISGTLSVASESGCLSPDSMGSTHFHMASDCSSSSSTWTYYKTYNVLLSPWNYCMRAKSSHSDPIEFDMCQHSNGDYEKDKYHVKFEDCHGQSCHGYIKSAKDGKCLSHQDGYFHFKPCDHSDKKQRFVLDDSKPTPTTHPTHGPTSYPTYSPTGVDHAAQTIKHVLSGLCMDIKDGTHQLQISKCDGSKHQLWHYKNDKIKTKKGNQCVGIKGNIEDGGKLRLLECDNSEEQRWELSPKGWFKSKADPHFCIDVVGSMTTQEGSSLQVGTCMLLNLLSDQRWELHDHDA